VEHGKTARTLGSTQSSYNPPGQPAWQDGVAIESQKQKKGNGGGKGERYVNAKSDPILRSKRKAEVFNASNRVIVAEDIDDSGAKCRSTPTREKSENTSAGIGAAHALQRLRGSATSRRLDESTQTMHRLLNLFLAPVL